MKRVLNAAQMKFCDEKEINERTPSHVLMERAAEKVLEVVKTMNTKKVLFVCGSGNNGGDGLLCAVMACGEGIDCDVMFVGREEKCTPECARRLDEARKIGVRFVETFEFANYTLIVDAIFGIGLNSDVTGKYADVINAINESGAEVLSVDIPSGVFADNGGGEVTVKADVTVAIQAYKFGNLYSEANGKLLCCDIEIPTDVEGAPCALEDADIPKLLPKRKADSNKGTYGRVLVVGGEVGMCGAVYLSALAAYRCGAGLVEILTSEENRLALQTLLPEAVLTCVSWEDADLRKVNASLERADAVCVGMGMGQSMGALRLLRFVLDTAGKKLVMDADALNLCAKHGLSIPGGSVITPHPMELSRLTKITVTTLKADLLYYAKEFSRERNITVIAKDYRSVIASNTTSYINVSGTPAMAKGGSGDVLSGAVAAFLCRGMTSESAAALAAFVHGRAGEKCASEMGENGVLAREIADRMARVLMEAGR